MKFLKQYALLAVLGLMLVSVQANAATLSFSPENPTFHGTDEQVVELMIDDITGLLGATVTVAYDPAVVTPVSVVPGDFLNIAGCNFFYDWVDQGSELGTVQVDVAFFGCTASGSGSYLTMTFAGLGTGSSPLTVTDADFRNDANEAIEVELLSGNINYMASIDATLSFTPDAVLFEEDGTTEICLNMVDVDDFLGMSVTLGFDPAVIVPVSIASGDALDNAGCPFFLDWVNPDGFTDTMVLDMALLGCVASMNGPMVCITFQGVGFGESPLTWNEADVRDSNNDPILINTVNGVVMFNSAVTSKPVSFGELKSIYR